MPEALSQSQIDELLKKMQFGEINETTESKRKIKDYDFSIPKKFTKDQLKLLNTLYENFSRVISSYFTSLLRGLCEVTVVGIEEQRYYEFNNALSDTVLVTMMDFKPEQQDETTMLMELSTSFGYLLVERLMGGSSSPYIPDRDYTEIEIAMLRHVNNTISQYLKEAWNNYLPVQIELRSIETNGRLLQAFSPQDVVVIVSFEMKGIDFASNGNICMSAENLDALITSFNSRYYKSTTKQQDPEKEKIRRDMVLDYLSQSDLEMEVILDNCEISLGDLMQLQVNDVISLNKKINDDLCVLVEGTPWFSGRLGEMDTKKAIKLMSSIEK